MRKYEAFVRANDQPNKSAKKAAALIYEQMARSFNKTLSQRTVYSYLRAKRSGFASYTHYLDFFSQSRGYESRNHEIRCKAHQYPLSAELCGKSSVQQKFEISLQLHPLSLEHVVVSEHNLDRAELLEMIDYFLDNALTLREKDIVQRRYWKKQTLKEIGTGYGIKAERVRQLLGRVATQIRKTENFSKGNKLRAILDFENVSFDTLAYCEEVPADEIDLDKEPDRVVEWLWEFGRTD